MSRRIPNIQRGEASTITDNAHVKPLAFQTTEIPRKTAHVKFVTKILHAVPQRARGLKELKKVQKFFLFIQKSN
jgi:hypothetical protein